MNSTQFTSEITELKQRLSDKDQRIKTLEEYIRYMKQQQFGASSEKLSADQMVLFDESEALDLDIDTEDETVDIPTHTRKKKRASIPAHLPHTDEGTRRGHVGDRESTRAARNVGGTAAAGLV